MTPMPRHHDADDDSCSNRATHFVYYRIPENCTYLNCTWIVPEKIVSKSLTLAFLLYVIRNLILIKSLWTFKYISTYVMSQGNWTKIFKVRYIDVNDLVRVYEAHAHVHIPTYIPTLIRLKSSFLRSLFENWMNPFLETHSIDINILSCVTFTGMAEKNFLERLFFKTWVDFKRMEKLLESQLRLFSFKFHSSVENPSGTPRARIRLKKLKFLPSYQMPSR
jgi:hypothetical protein